MLANEARRIASKVIWERLPNIIRYAIEDAVEEGKLDCELRFPGETADFKNCVKYFNDLNKLGYKTDMCEDWKNGKYVIRITW